MTKINFAHINLCPVDSELVKELKKTMHSDFSNPNSIHSFGIATKAEIEESRNSFAELLNVQSNELSFLNDSISQTKLLISHCILLLNIKHIVTSKFENTSILNYLKALEHSKKVKLSFIETNSVGTINFNKLKEQVRAEKPTLLSLSHVNEYNGMLLPVKDILQICNNNKVLFHLNLKLSIGKYNIDFQKIKADFISFDFSAEQVLKNSGIFFLNQSIKISDYDFHILKSTLKNSENINVFQIKSMLLTFSNSLNNLQKYQIQINKLREYFISEFTNNFNKKHLLAEYNKDGFYNILSYFLTQKQFGKIIAEKLDMNRIVVDRINYPEFIKDKGEYIRFSFGKENTIPDINFLINVLKRIHQ